MQRIVRIAGEPFTQMPHRGVQLSRLTFEHAGVHGKLRDAVGAHIIEITPRGDSGEDTAAHSHEQLSPIRAPASQRRRYPVQRNRRQPQDRRRHDHAEPPVGEEDETGAEADRQQPRERCEAAPRTPEQEQPGAAQGQDQSKAEREDGAPVDQLCAVCHSMSLVFGSSRSTHVQTNFFHSKPSARPGSA